jgi:glycosyltransferase involved in cell wall biosynthesis
MLKQKAKLINILVIVLVVAFALFLLSKNISQTEVVDFVSSFGIWAPIIYIVLLTSTYVIAPLSGTFVFMAGFVMFGGSIRFLLLNYVAAALSVVINFKIARIWGRGAVKKLVGEKSMSKVDDFIVDYGEKSLLLMRLFQGHFHDFISYAYGLTNINFSNYFVISLLAPIPYTVFFYFFVLKNADNVFEFSYLLFLSLVPFWIITVFLYFKYRKDIKIKQKASKINNMLIGIDGNEANIKNRVGVNRYAYEVLRGLHKVAHSEKGKHEFIIYLKEKPLFDLPKESGKWKYEILSGRGMWILTRLMPHLLFSGHKPAVLFSPSHYVPPFSSVPMVCSIMDLGYLKFSGQFKKYTFWQLKYWTAISINVSKRIISISNATKRDIEQNYKSAKGKVVVTPLAHDKTRYNAAISRKEVAAVKRKYNTGDDYILFLSTLKPSKNLEGFLDAYASLGKNKYPNSKHKLVVAGKKGWLYESIFEKVKKLGLTKQVVFTDYFPESEKPALYAGAKVLVAPSFWEGFGLQALESMACGTPVVVSAAGSLPEVVGSAGVIVNANSTKSISNGLLKVLKMDPKGYNKLVNRGLKQAEHFDWDITAEKTIKVIEQAVIK